jgi:hypothetical protein
MEQRQMSIKTHVRRHARIAIIAVCASMFGGCATLDRDPASAGYEVRKTSFWVQPPRDEQQTPMVGISIPW